MTIHEHSLALFAPVPPCHALSPISSLPFPLAFPQPLHCLNLACSSQRSPQTSCPRETERAGVAGQVGDFVLQVNGENVVGYPVANIRERIVGPVGSSVRVMFESAVTGQQYEVRGTPLSRKFAQYQSRVVSGGVKDPDSLGGVVGSELSCAGMRSISRFSNSPPRLHNCPPPATRQFTSHL